MFVILSKAVMQKGFKYMMSMNIHVNILLICSMGFMKSHKSTFPDLIRYHMRKSN